MVTGTTVGSGAAGKTADIARATGSKWRTLRVATAVVCIRHNVVADAFRGKLLRAQGVVPYIRVESHVHVQTRVSSDSIAATSATGLLHCCGDDVSRRA
jgi:hypothetical protein